MATAPEDPRFQDVRFPHVSIGITLTFLDGFSLYSRVERTILPEIHRDWNSEIEAALSEMVTRMEEYKAQKLEQEA